MIKDVTNSIKATLYQRVNSPLYGTFIFAWMLYNWEKTLQLAFGSKGFDARLAVFKSSFKHSDTGGSDYWAFLVPILTTAFILFFQPIIQRMIFVHYEKNKNIGLNERDKLEGDRRLSVEESMALKDDLSKFHEKNKISLQIKEEENQGLMRKYEAQVQISKDIESEKNKILNDFDVQKNRMKDYLNDRGIFDRTISDLKKDNSDIVSNYEDKIHNLKEVSSKEIESLNNNLDHVEAMYNNISSKSNNEIERLNIKVSILKSELEDEKDKFQMILESTEWFLNDSFKREFPQLFILHRDGDFSIQTNLYDKLLHESDDPEWAKSCFTLMIYGFGRSYSYDYADGYFTNIIRPYLKDFDEDDFTLLIETMNSNGQIKDRARAERDMRVVQNKREELREFS